MEVCVRASLSLVLAICTEWWSKLFLSTSHIATQPSSHWAAETRSMIAPPSARISRLSAASQGPDLQTPIPHPHSAGHWTLSAVFA